MSWRRNTITIAMACSPLRRGLSPHQVVDGYTLDGEPWGVHRTAGGLWAVDHLPSGYRIGPTYPTLRGAKAAVAAIVATGRDYARAKLHRADVDAIKQAVRA